MVTRLYCGYGKWSHEYTVARESVHTTILWLRQVFTRLYCGYGKWSHGWSGDGARLFPLHAHYCIPRLPTLTYNQNKALAANKVRHGVIKQQNVKFKQLEGNLAIWGCDGDRSGDCFCSISVIRKMLCCGHYPEVIPYQRLPTILNFYSPMVTICTASLTFNNSAFCPHKAFMCFVWIWEQTANISLYNINWLDFITEI